MKKVLAYRTGQPIPDGAEYLTTTIEETLTHIEGSSVWHYFLVDAAEAVPFRVSHLAALKTNKEPHGKN